MNPATKIFELNPHTITESLARGCVNRLRDECIKNIDTIHIQSNGGYKNLQKKCKAIFKDGTVSGLYIGEKNCLAMFVKYDEIKKMFTGAYLSKVNGEFSLYESDIRFSRHSIQRLIERLKTKHPRIEVAKAIHSQTKYAFSREAQKGINIHQKYRMPGFNDVDIALPYFENDALLGMWFIASTSDFYCNYVGKMVVKTFVDAEKLREPQYESCIEQYYAQLDSLSSGEKMQEANLI
ncbi:hypothetical protein DSLASN_10920 [Desulfoluna limicola]|uniref:Uncharacterized protein n=1 Tax=Desulfoluna limicola TaxID=2810562 RepID=A0ABN6F1G9_9BACT|nr:hypothetical protein [Desulfoluna limicola]BCS95460.1 hypothetical protein DSLASN_10920 [Desulfoluna limicola]